MIESLAEHGVDPSDLVPALMTTHTVKNPEYDPAAAKRKDVDDEKAMMRGMEGLDDEGEAEILPAYEAPSAMREGEKQVMDKPTPIYSESALSDPTITPRRPSTSPGIHKKVNPFGDDDEDGLAEPPTPNSSSSRSTLTRPAPSRLSSFNLDDEDVDGDIGRAASPSAPHISLPEVPPLSISPSTPPTPTATSSEPLHDPEKTPSQGCSRAASSGDPEEPPEPQEPEEQAPLPSLPGVSTKMSTTDEMITLDIRWTVVSRL